VTYLGAIVQLVSVIWDKAIWGVPVFPTMIEDGLILMLLGTILFIMAIIAMRNDWRAGYHEGQNTKLVTSSVYKYSRNPAFLSFDSLYIGCALAFPNALNISFAVVAILLFHLQILGEEKFLVVTFGQQYINYKSATMRYLGRKKQV
jgi:protein-S-isoprenylcysteine O-methyltransferase Ste14